MLGEYIRTIPGFPKEGIQFKDISPLLANPDAFYECIGELSRQFDLGGFDSIGAFDARGFLFGAPLAVYTNKPLFPIRKAGKLPGEVVSEGYSLEYGENTVEVQSDAVKQGDKVLLIDDLLATGGTMKAGCNLVEKLGGEVVGCQFVIELQDLPGRETLEGYEIKSLLKY